MSQKKPVRQQPQKVVIPQKPGRDFYLVFLCVIIAIVSIIRYRLISLPLERDEGEYAYIGSLFLHGVAPFKDAYSMKLPGTSFMYAILMFIFGQSNTGVHLGLLFLNAATMYLLYVGLKKIFNPFIAVATSTIYGFMAVGFVFDGFSAHATHFICFHTSIALLFLANYLKSGKALHAFLFGLMLGMSFLMKQQAVFLLLFGGLFLLVYFKIEKKQSVVETIKNTLPFAAGVIIPYIVVLLIIAVSGQFAMFWLWTVKYASSYEAVKGMDLISIYFKSTFIPAWDVYSYFWLLALAGILILYRSSYTRIQKIFAIGYFIASACAVSSGFYFRQHYFVVVLPAIGLLSAIFIEFVIKQAKLKASTTPLYILSFIVLITLYINRQYFFSTPVNSVCNNAYWGNPFNEAKEIAKYIQANSKDTDKIAVLGSEPEIYFYANRRAATGFLYTYPLVDNQPFNVIMQDQMIKEIEDAKPAFIVFCNITYSWVPQAGSPKKIFEWGNAYTHANYTPVGFVDFYSASGWQYFLGDDIRNRSGQPESFIIIFKRNPPGVVSQPVKS